MFIRGLLMFLLGIVLMVLMIIDFQTEYISIFFDAATFIMFLITISAVIISQRDFKPFVASINALISKKYHISAADKEKGIRLFKLIHKTVYATACLCVVGGSLNMLTNLDDLAYLGPNVAVILLALLYGIIINMVFVNPAINILETRYNTEEKTVISEKQVIDKLLEMCYKQGISPEDIIGAKEIKIL